MKKLLLLLASVAVFAISCQTDTTTDNSFGVGKDKSTTLVVSLTETRTSLGGKVGTNYPVYWSEGDKLVVNGYISDEVEIDDENRASALFTFSKAELVHPYYITYPYCASTTEEKPIVEFKAEQTYTEGSFSTNTAPMCGYTANRSERISLSHLAATLRVPVKAAFEGVVLEKVVITSQNKIAGEFAVDCKNATISATESCGNVVTYSLPANFALSTSNVSDLFITLPAINVGACTIEFVEPSGEKMVATWTPSAPLSKGVVREFKTVTYERKKTFGLELLPVEEDEFTIFYKNLSGYVRYSDGSPIANVAVSDGFQVVSTDANGYYELNDVTRETWYIYCSLPADVKVPINEYGQPCFFKKYPSSSPQYDFTFEKLPNGPEKEYVIFAMADPQPSNEEHVERFSAQAAPEIKSYAQSFSVPCYGIMLGDIVNNKEHLLDDMRDAMAYNYMGMPVFAVMGNHDNASVSSTNPIFPDERNSNINIKFQRPFEENFGPVNYSFNRGDVHFVCMRNTKYDSNVSAASSTTQRLFTDEQLEWLQQDLALVSRDKMIVLCVHEPMMTSSKLHNVKKVWSLMSEFAEAHILSGHLHINRPYDYRANGLEYDIYEHNISAICGRIWKSNLADDGSPCGYKVLYVKDNSFTKWYYKGFPYMMNDTNYQMRLYRGGEITGTAIPEGDANTNGTKGYYQFPYDRNVILANVFSSDPWRWSVEVWEDGEKMGEMTNLRDYNYTPSFAALIGSFVYDDPKRPADGVESGMDFYAVGVQLGWKGAKADSCYKPCYTMWKYTLSNPDAEHIEVIARDQFGNVYTCDEFQVGTDLTFAIYDSANNPVVE